MTIGAMEDDNNDRAIVNSLASVALNNTYVGQLEQQLASSQKTVTATLQSLEKDRKESEEANQILQQEFEVQGMKLATQVGDGLNLNSSQMTQLVANLKPVILKHEELKKTHFAMIHAEANRIRNEQYAKDKKGHRY